MGIFNFIGTTFSGWLSDRFDNYKLLMIYYSLRGISLIYLPYSDFSVYALTLWAIFFGLDFVSDVTFITAGSPPNPSIPDFPGETTSILTSSRFAFSSSRASFVASSTVLP